MNMVRVVRFLIYRGITKYADASSLRKDTLMKKDGPNLDGSSSIFSGPQQGVWVDLLAPLKYLMTSVSYWEWR